MVDEEEIIKVAKLIDKKITSGKLTEGKVKRILTSSQVHPHGIKVELDDGKIGRVQQLS